MEVEHECKDLWKEKHHKNEHLKLLSDKNRKTITIEQPYAAKHLHNFFSNNKTDLAQLILLDPIRFILPKCVNKNVLIKFVQVLNDVFVNGCVTLYPTNVKIPKWTQK